MAITSNRWMKPPIVYEETSPNSQRTIRITAMVSSILYFLRNEVASSGDPALLVRRGQQACPAKPTYCTRGRWDDLGRIFAPFLKRRAEAEVAAMRLHPLAGVLGAVVSGSFRETIRLAPSPEAAPKTRATASRRPRGSTRTV